MISQEYYEVELKINIENALNNLFKELSISNIKYEKIKNNSYFIESTATEQYRILNESVKDAIINFIKTVVEAVTKAWNNFKLLNNTKTKELINKNRNLLSTNFPMYCPKDFEIPEIKIWKSLNESVKILDFATNYDSWKKEKILESNETFIKAKYSDMTQPDKTIVQVMHDKCFRKVKDKEVIGKDIISEYVSFIEGFEKERDAISQDIDQLNASNKNIEARLKEIVSEATNYYIGNDIFSLLCEGETQTDNQQQTSQQDKNQNSFRSANPNDQKESDNKNKLAEDRKNIVTYYKASTQVFSAKLKTCRNIETTCEKIVKNFINLQLKNKSSQEKKENNTVTTTNQGSTTIQK